MTYSLIPFFEQITDP